MNFSINLATKVYVDFKKVNIVLFTTGAIILLLILFFGYTSVENANKISRLIEQKSKTAHGTGPAKVSESDYTAFLATVKSVNSIIYKRSYDWLLLLSNLERLVPEGVALKSLEPADKGASLRLSATARNFAAVRKFVENMENSKVFSEIYLTDQASVKDGVQKGLSFTVTCKVSAS